MPDVTIPVRVIRRTNLALLVDDGKTETWVPHSVIVQEIRERGQIDQETTAIVLQDWVAKDKGLVASQVDDATADLFGGAT